MTLVILVGLIAMPAAMAVGLQDVPDLNDSNECPGRDPRCPSELEETLWDYPLNLTAESNLDATRTFPNGFLLTDWLFTVDARSVLPIFRDSSASLHAGVTTRVVVLPTFESGFAMSLEFHANAFYAYGLGGASAAGIRAESGDDDWRDVVRWTYHGFRTGVIR